jgi:hypothetical protein
MPIMLLKANYKESSAVTLSDSKKLNRTEASDTQLIYRPEANELKQMHVLGAAAK